MHLSMLFLAVPGLRRCLSFFLAVVSGDSSPVAGSASGGSGFPFVAHSSRACELH